MAIPGDKYLINIDDIKRFRPVFEFDSERIGTIILEAQSHDLRPILGEALYYDFMKNYDNSNVAYDIYRDLLNGKEYTYNGYTVVHDGLHEMLVYFTLARFLPMNAVSITRFGAVRKKEERSEPITGEEMRNIVSDLRSNATRAANLVKKFLLYNIASYPLYQYGQVENQNKLSGVKFFDL